MKKMLMLFLILSVSSIASAFFRFSVNGVDDTARNSTAAVATITPSSHLTLDVWTDAVMSSASTYTWAMACVSSGATLGGGSYVGGLGHYDVTDDTETEYVGDNFKGLIYDDLIGVNLGDSSKGGIQGNFTIWKSGSIGSGQDDDGNPLAYPSVAKNTMLYDSIDLHCEGQTGLMTIYLYKLDNDTFSISRVDDSIVINQTPEPATMCLLGLGGLLLRRRIAA